MRNLRVVFVVLYVERVRSFVSEHTHALFHQLDVFVGWIVARLVEEPVLGLALVVVRFYTRMLGT